MKSPIIPVLVVAAIIGAAYYYLVVMKPKPDKKKETEQDVPDSKTDISGLDLSGFADKHSSEAIADYLAKESRTKYGIKI